MSVKHVLLTLSPSAFCFLKLPSTSMFYHFWPQEYFFGLKTNNKEQSLWFINIYKINTNILASCNYYLYFYQHLNVGKFHEKATFWTKSWEMCVFVKHYVWIKFRTKSQIFNTHSEPLVQNKWWAKVLKQLWKHLPLIFKYHYYHR